MSDELYAQYVCLQQHRLAVEKHLIDMNRNWRCTARDGKWPAEDQYRPKLIQTINLLRDLECMLYDRVIQG